MRPDAAQAARFGLGVLAILLLGVTLASFFWVMRLIRREERQFEETLEVKAGLIASTIPPGHLYYLETCWDEELGVTDFDRLAEYLDELPPTAETLQQILLKAMKLDQSIAVSILTPDGYLFLDRNGYHTLPDRSAELTRDLTLVSQAAAGQPAASDIQPSEETRRVYHPLIGSADNVVGVMRLEARRDFLPGVRRQIRRLAAATIISALVILFVWFAIARIVRRAQLAEKMAEQSDRLRALGTATAGIAHEIRNPLGIILLTTEELSAAAKTVEDKAIREDLMETIGGLKDETRRLNELTNQFLDFARTESKDARETVELNDSVERIVELFRKGAPMGLSIDFVRCSAPLNALFGEHRLRQVVLNLLRNAQDALAGREGRVEVTIRRERDKAILEVSDNGPGMDAATLAQVFDPFFTTRADGTGLGLPLSRSIVEAAGGELVLESTAGEGTTAKLTMKVGEG